MTHAHVQVAIIGSGVVGLASAAAIAGGGRSVAIIERNPRAGMETSTHNSGVIHAGLYYPHGSLKAQLCIEGADRLYAFCSAHSVPHVRCGKLVVAVDAGEHVVLEQLLAQGMSKRGARSRNGGPRIHPSPRAARGCGSGALVAQLRNRGCGCARSRAAAGVRASRRDGVVAAQHSWPVTPPAQGMSCCSKKKRSPAASSSTRPGFRPTGCQRCCDGETFTIYPCRGEYAELKPSRHDWVRGLVYPVPHQSGHGLGVHLTKTTGGGVLLGPTIRYQDDKGDYESGREPLEAFLEPARRLLPAVTLDDLRMGGSGIRAKLHPPDRAFCRFHDPPRPPATGVDPRRRHRLPRSDSVPGRRRTCRHAH